ncbi:MAG TPA: hypothetical protein VGI03_00090 [Verrucomicrobiae bacterium]|jgi:hypothetical protein
MDKYCFIQLGFFITAILSSTCLLRIDDEAPPGLPETAKARKLFSRKERQGRKGAFESEGVKKHPKKVRALSREFFKISLRPWRAFREVCFT